MSQGLVTTFKTLGYVNPAVAANLGRGCGAVASMFNTQSKRQLIANHQRLSSKPLDSAHVRKAFASYFEMFAQASSLPRWSKARITQSVSMEEHFQRVVSQESGPIVVAMTHSGNWDLAAAFASFHLAPVVTVAEVVEPPELFDYFVQTREAFGMKVLPAKRGVFAQLREYVRDKHVMVPLLADRDISGRGVEVDFGGHPALVAAGPAALASQLDAPLFALHMSRVPGREVTYQMQSRQVEVTGDVQADTQRWVDAIVPLIRANLADWHMMQPLFVDDLDPARLARARERAKREDTQ
ncbi:phosphatidylinositol mannoside acyltransferase [Gleimia europaea]|uniref:Lipid A biosynthesis lauroyl acyltransferase n=1 Tax=Gleimia europaea ACS-120-V-Col10b TaxID=883069 RepID=A0A9W5RDP5_9ACTO|nr:phosphatidylinositol mannoside acyltransferase [Gleimia europaea]EPD30421.1 hypothetical protein HMPREF9238_00164 [Gleimia europaea ACS-120-V-Col10b]